MQLVGFELNDANRFQNHSSIVHRHWQILVNKDRCLLFLQISLSLFGIHSYLCTFDHILSRSIQFVGSY